MRRAVLVAAALALALPSVVAASGRITVLAAASLTQVFPRIEKAARYDFAGSD